MFGQVYVHSGTGIYQVPMGQGRSYYGFVVFIVAHSEDDTFACGLLGHSYQKLDILLYLARAENDKRQAGGIEDFPYYTPGLLSRGLVAFGIG